MKYLKREASSGFDVGPRELVSIQVDLEPVADITNEETSPIPPDEPFLIGDELADLEACRAPPLQRCPARRISLSISTVWLGTSGWTTAVIEFRSRPNGICTSPIMMY